MVNLRNTWIVACLLPAVNLSAARADDAVWYLPPAAASVGQSGWLPQPLRKLSGTIESFDQQQVQLVVEDRSLPGGSAARSIPFERIVWIQVDWSVEGTAVEQAFDDFHSQRYEACLQPMSQFIRQAKTQWRQLIAYGYVMYAAAEADKHGSALAIAAGFYDAGPPECLYGLFPIAWSTPPANAARDQAALAALDHANAAVRLIAASWLLTGANRQRADAVLQRISNDPADAVLARLADAVRWRLAAGPQVQQSVERWQEKIDQLPIALQAGPMTTVADRLQSSGQADEALLWWLSVAKLGRQPGRLAVDAEAKVNMHQAR